MVVKYICNATWKTCKIEISILNGNYFFLYLIHKCIFSFMVCKGRNKLQQLNTSLHSSVWRYIEGANTSKYRIIGNFCSQKRSEGGVISEFNCIHKDKTYTVFKLKWPPCWKWSGNTFGSYFHSLIGKNAYDITTFSLPPSSFKIFNRVTNFHATWNRTLWHCRAP
jgi:hypothetical protein